MASRLEYHKFVRSSIPAPVALFSLIALPVILTFSAFAQTNGAPASVTSPGFGGHAVNGTRPSVTSLGPSGVTPNSGVTFSAPPPVARDDGHHHQHHHPKDNAGIFYAVPVPYAVDLGATNDAVDASAADDSDANYQGGPTIFDRRGSGAESYVPPVRDLSAPHSTQLADADPPAPEPPQEPTLLVFKDGRKLEVGNYAIVGITLFDMTPGHPRKVGLADLDLEATQKQNDDRGVSFQLPPSSQAN